jgi:hypothetical protein
MSKIIDLFEDNQLENREKRIEKTKVSIICIQDRTQQETHFSFPPPKKPRKRKENIHRKKMW